MRGRLSCFEGFGGKKGGLSWEWWLGLRLWLGSGAEMVGKLWRMYLWLGLDGNGCLGLYFGPKNCGAESAKFETALTLM